MTTTRRDITLDRIARIVGAIMIVAGVVWLIDTLRDVLLPFCLACLIAYMLEPIVEFNSRLLRVKGRALPVIVTLVEVTALIGLLLYLIVPSVIDEIHDMIGLVEKYSSKGAPAALVPREIYNFLERNINAALIEDLIRNGRFDTIISRGTSVVGVAMDFMLHTIEWLLTFIYVIFVMLDYPQLMRGFRMLIPPKYRHMAFRTGNDIKVSMNRYFRGQACIALCAMVFYCIGFSIVGIPLALVLGVTVGVLYMIPYFQYITLVPVAIVCLISAMGGGAAFWPEFGKCLLVYGISQTICDYILTPKIMGKAMGLNPAIILLSLSVWGTLLGLIGMIIALPLTTLLLSYYREYVISRPQRRQSQSESETTAELSDK